MMARYAALGGEQRGQRLPTRQPVAAKRKRQINRLPRIIHFRAYAAPFGHRPVPGALVIRIGPSQDLTNGQTWLVTEILDAPFGCQQSRQRVAPRQSTSTQSQGNSDGVPR